MDFIEELRWRGMLHNHTEEIEELLQMQKVCGYIGFDPTAPSLTIGNYIQIMILHFFQRAGHKPIVLMGGATGRVGDPSGKDTERTLLSHEQLDENLAHQMKQFHKYLDFNDDGTGAMAVNNLDFYADMNVLNFLRDVGKSISISYMLAKDSVKNRLEKGLSFTEFSYQLLQAYDFQCLYQSHNCILQMGGSDQWGNITSGTEFIRRNLGKKAHAITTPLLTKSDGSKFGKSSEGNIWLDPGLTSPYKFYQFWINTADDDLGKFLRYFSFRNKDEIEQLEKTYGNDMQGLKKILAEEMTIRIHGKDQYQAVMTVSELLFNKKADENFLKNIGPQEWNAIAEEIPTHKLSKEALADGVGVIELIADLTPIVSSKGDARRAIKGNALRINKKKVTDLNQSVDNSWLLHGEFLMIENGKKNKFLVTAY
ncbi:MAG: tyrosine--tRNA ligase [Saprospiraceae bacterium]|nr:tyrosine--tRNA ligase [Saprospiraceae bacterium]